ncbi:hypothetical protein Tco_1517073, partial [Tanacetum coccineum]
MIGTRLQVRGTVHTRWHVRGTVHTRWQARGGRHEVSGNVRWQYEVAAAGQSENDTCPKRVIRGCQACVSP